MQLAKLRIELNELREELDISIKEENFSRAAEIKEQIAKLEDRSMEICALNEPQNQTMRVEKVGRYVCLYCKLCMCHFNWLAYHMNCKRSVNSFICTLIHSFFSC